MTITELLYDDRTCVVSVASTSDLVWTWSFRAPAGDESFEVALVMYSSVYLCRLCPPQPRYSETLSWSLGHPRSESACIFGNLCASSSRNKRTIGVGIKGFRIPNESTARGGRCSISSATISRQIDSECEVGCSRRKRPSRNRTPNAGDLCPYCACKGNPYSVRLMNTRRLVDCNSVRDMPIAYAKTSEPY